MHKYRAILECKEPIAPGFSCAAMDVLDFDYAGEMLTVERTARAINERKNKACSKCFGANWIVRGLTQLTAGMGSNVSRN